MQGFHPVYFFVKYYFGKEIKNGVMAMKYKMICLDMDGTLLNDKKEISQGNRLAIEKAKAAGAKVVICTGRLYQAALYYDDYLGLGTPVITANGAYIRDRRADRIIFKAELGRDNCCYIYDTLKKYKISPIFHTPYGVYTEKDNPTYDMYTKMNSTLPEGRKMKIEFVSDWNKVFSEAEEDILKCIAIEDNDYERLQEAKNELVKNKGLELSSSFKNNCEVMAAGITKGKGVEKLAEYFGLTKEEVICVGDNENDLSMIEYAGLGVAMGNGEDFVKAKAEYVTSSNNEDGVARVIEKFILSK